MSAIFLPALIPFVLLMLIACLMYVVRNRMGYDIESDGLRLRGGGYGRLVRWTSIDRAGVQMIDLNSSSEYQPTLRTNGIGLPGVQVGWFKLRNGQSALLFVSNLSSVAKIPTHDGFVLLVSVQDSNALMNAISSSAAPT
jgi:Bacterial PH domain